MYSLAPPLSGSCSVHHVLSSPSFSVSVRLRQWCSVAFAELASARNQIHLSHTDTQKIKEERHSLIFSLGIKVLSLIQMSWILCMYSEVKEKQWWLLFSRLGTVLYNKPEFLLCFCHVCRCVFNWSSSWFICICWQDRWPEMGHWPLGITCYVVSLHHYTSVCMTVIVNAVVTGVFLCTPLGAPSILLLSLDHVVPLCLGPTFSAAEVFFSDRFRTEFLQRSQIDAKYSNTYAHTQS